MTDEPNENVIAGKPAPKREEKPITGTRHLIDEQVFGKTDEADDPDAAKRAEEARKAQAKVEEDRHQQARKGR